MRIVHFVCVAPPETGGIGQAAYREVQDLISRGHDAVLIAPAIKTAPSDPLVLRLSPVLRFGNASWLRGVSDVIRTADIVHLHYPFYGTDLAVVRACKALNKPLVITFHMDAKAGDWRDMVFAMHRRLFQKTVFEQASRVLVSSLDYAKHSSLAKWIESHRELVVELPFGIDTEFWSPSTSMAKKGTSEQMDLLFVGGLDRAHRFKGLPELLDSLSRLPIQTHLRVVGVGDDQSHYEARVKELGLVDRVHFLGRLSREDLREEFRKAEVFVFPSTSSAEAFGLVAVEAQACGVPVIASDLPGVRTVVADGESGILVPPRDAEALIQVLSRLLSDENLRVRFGRAGRERVLRLFDEKKHTDELMVTYQKALAL